jgi:hypothetical protein
MTLYKVINFDFFSRNLYKKKSYIKIYMGALKEYETKTYTEYVDIGDVYKIVQNWSDIFKQLPEKRQEGIKKYTEETGYDPILSLKKLLKQKSNIIHTKYSFSKNLVSYGRLFSKTPSLSSMPREIRNTLAYKCYYDIDFVNCHPMILSQYCNKNNIRCDMLDSYIKNRNKILDDICKENKIERDDAKQLVLALMNGGKGNNFADNDETFLGKFKIEMNKIQDTICNINSDEFKKIQKRKDYNCKGSLINILLCKKEHELLMNSVAFMTEKGYNVDVLVFDGFMVRKDKPLSKELLLELEKYIKDKTDYDMQLLEKEMTNIIDLSIYKEPVEENKTENTYYKDKEEFEKSHLKITHPALYLTLMDEGNVELQNETQLISSYRHIKTVYDEKKESFITKWINDENIRIYRRLVFIPSDNYDSRDYNSWKGFHNEKIPLPDDFDINNNVYIEMFKDFVGNLLSQNKSMVNYLIAWFANIIQNPDKRSCICIALYSYEEGVGKNMLIKTIEKCIGEIYMNYITDAQNQLFGKHSSAELNKLLISLNELKGKDAYSNSDLFKTRITDDKREVELKQKDTMLINNYCSYIINTNNLNMVNAGDKDRRFCVMDCNNVKINDKLYFSNYETKVNKNPEAIRCIFEYLKHFDIESVVPNKIWCQARPSSSLYQDLVECNKPNEWEYILYFAEKNKGKKRYYVGYSDIWLDYKTFCSRSNLDISKLSTKRFLFIFNRTIVNCINNTEGYDNTFEKKRYARSKGYMVDSDKLTKYFNLDDYEEKPDDGFE